jgi:hypothetical protein
VLAPYSLMVPVPNMHVCSHPVSTLLALSSLCPSFKSFTSTYHLFSSEINSIPS